MQNWCRTLFWDCKSDQMSSGWPFFLLEKTAQTLLVKNVLTLLMRVLRSITRSTGARGMTCRWLISLVLLKLHAISTSTSCKWHKLCQTWQSIVLATYWLETRYQLQWSGSVLLLVRYYKIDQCHKLFRAHSHTILINLWPHHDRCWEVTDSSCGKSTTNYLWYRAHPSSMWSPLSILCWHQLTLQHLEAACSLQLFSKTGELCI